MGVSEPGRGDSAGACVGEILDRHVEGVEPDPFERILEPLQMFVQCEETPVVDPDTLEHTIAVEETVIPDQDPDYATLLWATLFDERMLVDLTSTLGWRSDEVADALSTQLMAALRAPNQPRGGSRLRVSSSSSA